MDQIIALILAAGEGKRMKSKYSKVVHKACGSPIIKWVCSAVKEAGIEDIAVVIGHHAEQVRECLEKSMTMFISSSNWEQVML